MLGLGHIIKKPQRFHWLGILADSACVMLTDFTLTTQRGELLDEEGVKNLFDVDEGGDVKAREHCVQFPRKMPRAFATNGDHFSSLSLFHTSIDAFPSYSYRRFQSYVFIDAFEAIVIS
jgi:hypothetical protein